MPSLKFTQEAIDALRPPPDGRVYFWDDTTPGFGLRISARGKRTWVAMYRVAGKSVMETIGTGAETPSVKDARKRAQRSLQKAREGTNPVAEKREAVKRERDRLSFAEAARRYLVEHVERKCRPSTIRETRRILDRDVIPVWGDLAVAEITKDDIEELLARKASGRARNRRNCDGGAGVQANRTLARLKTMFGWAVTKRLITTDPTAGIEKPVEEVARDRVLDDDEIIAFWNGCDGFGYPFGRLMQLLLVTGQRRNEVTGMRWAEINFEKRQWTIPRERAKNDKAHVVHLSDLAIEILQGLPQDQELVFTTTGSTFVSGFSKVKLRLDKRMEDELDRAIEPWTLHDLRRTAASGMAQLNVPPHVVDKILNHTSSDLRGLALVYNRYSYMPERVAAIDAWARHIEGLIRPKTDNVVAMGVRAD